LWVLNEGKGEAMNRRRWKHDHWCPDCDTAWGSCEYGEECRAEGPHRLCVMCRELHKAERDMTKGKVSRGR